MNNCGCEIKHCPEHHAGLELVNLAQELVTWCYKWFSVQGELAVKNAGGVTEDKELISIALRIEALLKKVREEER